MPTHDYYAAGIRQYAGQEATIRFEFYAHEVHAEAPWPGTVQALDDFYFHQVLRTEGEAKALMSRPECGKCAIGT